MNEESSERRECEQNTNDNSGIEEHLLAASAGVICGAKIVAAKSAAHRRASLLQQYADNEQYREHYLYIGEDPR